MSFSSLNFSSLHSPSYLATDNNSNNSRIGILDFRNVVEEATRTKCCTMQFFVERKLSATFKRAGAGAGSRGARFCIGNRIKIELQPRVKCTNSRVSTTVSIPQKVGDVSLNKEENVDLDAGNGGSGYSSGSSGNGKFPPGGGGGGGGDGGGNRDDNKDDNGEEHEFGPLLKYDDIVKEVEARGTSLPADMLEAAKSTGIQKVLLDRYLDMQGSVWPLGAAMKSCSIFRNIMLADPSFLFKVGTEIIIDSCCATFAEVQKRGKDFWAEFELYAADLLVGVVVNVALVGMLAPYARIGKPSTSNGLLGKMAHAYGALPSSVFEAERPGCSFSVRQRIETYFYKGVLYGTVGFMCGLVGQGIANLIMTAKRTVKKSEEDIPVPPLIKSAALWGVFLAVSSNTRYQIINGMERLVEASPVARRIPPVAMAFTVGVRFANNIYGGMQFVDWARLSGVQ
ncbi:protein RETICULATA, chloroplastic-like [Iris pallida]|uniref:Protein RETICULATA, chloroplastic-like n=1 Tax=Iris pallida TaxID=29817 RepID=A0AAX6GRF4_IRIPA|nr:protein RETICULATA, chloroplastic-like [Iris pallida]